MKGLFSTAYFPPISYFSKLIELDSISFEIHETYIKQSFRNRCTILTANGLQNLIVPVKRPLGNHSSTHTVYPDHTINWPIQHLRSLHAAYKSSPYYDHYIPYFEEILSEKWKTLVGLNDTLILKIAELIKADLSFSHTVSFDKNPEQYLDFRDYFSPKKTIQKTTFNPYYQVFSDRFTFQKDLSILDLLFNEGPQSLVYLKSLNIISPDKQS
jgi:hypothetical protein